MYYIVGGLGHALTSRAAASLRSCDSSRFLSSPFAASFHTSRSLDYPRVNRGSVVRASQEPQAPTTSNLKPGTVLEDGRRVGPDGRIIPSPDEASRGPGNSGYIDVFFYI